MPVRQQAIIWINDSLVYWHIYASLGFNELKNATTSNCFGNAGLKIQTSWRIICYYWTYQLRYCGHPKYMHDHCPIMMTSSNGNVFRVTGPLCGEFTVPGEFPSQRPVTQSFDVFFHLGLNKRFSKQSWGWWFEKPSWSLWRHCNDTNLSVVSLVVSVNLLGAISKSHKIFDVL